MNEGINWSRGLRRAAYVFLGFIWVVTLATVIIDHQDAFILGKTITYLGLFSLAYLFVCYLLAWVFRGFRR